MSLPIANCRLAMGIRKTPVIFAEEGCLLSLDGFAAKVGEADG